MIYKNLMPKKEEGDNLERSLGRLEGKMDSVMSTVTALAASFENLEKGRLSNLEIAFAKIQTEVSERSRSTAVLTSSIVSLIVAVLGYLFTKIF